MINSILFATEIDTMAPRKSQDWSNWSDAMRSFFHHEEYSLYRRTDKEFLDLPCPRLSISISGTPDQLKNLIPDYRNGLFSRFMYYNFSSSVPFRDPFASKRNIKEELEPVAKEILSIYQTLEKGEEIEFQLTESQEKRFYKLFDGEHKEFVLYNGVKLVSIPFRLGLIHYRISMVLSVLRTPPGQPIICNDLDFEIATELVKVLKIHSIAVLNLLPENESDIDSEKIKHKEFYEKLPESFSSKEAIDIGTQFEISRRTVYRVLEYFKGTGLIIKVRMGHYNKVNNDTIDTIDTIDTSREDDQ